MCLSLSNSLLICKCLQIKSVSSTILSFWKLKHPPPTCSLPRPRSQVCIGRSHDYSGGASRGCFRLSRTLTWLDSGDSPRRSGKMHACFLGRADIICAATMFPKIQIVLDVLWTECSLKYQWVRGGHTDIIYVTSSASVKYFFSPGKIVYKSQER